MLFELTILASFAIYHLLIGFSLFCLLTLLFKLYKFTAEMQSWLWITAFIIATAVPFSLFIESPSSEMLIAQRQSAKQTANVVQQTNTQNNSKNIINNRFESQSPFEWNVSSKKVLGVTFWIYFLLMVWLLGAFWRGIKVASAFLRTQKLIDSATELDNRLPFKHISSVPVLLAEGITSPMATGFLSPVILMPKSLINKLIGKNLDPIILHEVAHIERRDLWMSAFQETLAIIYWWSPIMRVLNRKIHISRELACDMRAAKHLSSGKTYAQSLIDCAQLMLSQHSNVLAMGLFSKKSELNYRIHEVLKIKSIKSPKAITTALACLTLVATSIVTAQNYAPKINVSNIKLEANHYSSISHQEGEKLERAIRTDDRKSLDAMINQGLDINTPFSGEGTALIIAVRHNNQELVTDLLNMGADINQSSEGDGSPLMEAVKYNRMAMVEYLYDNGADVNSKAFGDGSPLIEAAKHDSLEIAKFLITNGAEVDMSVEGDETPLINASQSGNVAMVKFLVEEGADVNLGMHTDTTRGGQFRTPLNMAANEQVKSYLMSKGATK